MKKFIVIFLISVACVFTIVNYTEKPMAPTYDSTEFIKGYKDGWDNKWSGAIYWTLSRDYRQGHMVGLFDKQNEKKQQY